MNYNYREHAQSILKFPKHMVEKIEKQEYKITERANQICINVPIFELERLYDRINQLERAVKKRRKK
jgi:hypothetical protein